ncbi:hypothetical protein ABZ499_30185 [Streptomyces sp. NPDC019990]|uniref:hypothetical protein n=1 Tax=Streptomyces sp. NPDC019990 TaxID=3154693 RepID=UPI003407AFB6
MNARRNVSNYERLPQHSEAHLNWAFVTLMTRRLTMTGVSRAASLNWWASASAFSSSGRALMRVLIYSWRIL